MILLVSSKTDLTTDYLIARLRSRGVPFYRLNSEDALDAFDLTLDVSSKHSEFVIFDRTRELQIASSAITGAYFRRPVEPILSSVQDSEERSYVQRELIESLRSLWRLLHKDVWLNSPEALWTAGNKIKQLTVAGALGLTIPRTFVSSRTIDILDFIESIGGEAVCKSLRHGYFGDETEISVILTSKIGRQDLDDLRCRDQTLPMIVQPLIAKKLDVRVTIVGDRIFSAGIHSQEHVDTVIDWRKADLDEGVDLRHEELSLPEWLQEKCLELANRLELKFACMDFVLTPDNDYVFLEVNPNGQWGWLEEAVGFPIRDAIIDELFERKQRTLCQKR